MAEAIYLDTSALAKWYLNEIGSDEVEAYLLREAPVAISTLTVVEMRCLLARRRRVAEIDPMLEMRIFATFEEDMRAGHLVRHPVEDAMVGAAPGLIAAAADHPLRSLDALHLAIAIGLGATTVATADRVMAGAAESLDLQVKRFG